MWGNFTGTRVAGSISIVCGVGVGISAGNTRTARYATAADVGWGSSSSINAIVVIITIIAAFLKNFMDLEIVQHAFAGIRVAVCVLITIAIIKLAKKNIKNNIGILLAITVFLLVTFTNISSVYVIIAAIIFGLLWKRGKQA